jgi:hypothetical protein
MNEAKRKHGIEETQDVIDFVGLVAEALRQAKSDDGKIDRAEVMAAAAENAAGAAKAMMGAWDIPQELQDLDEREKEELLNSAIPVLLDLAKLFIPGGS